MPLTRLANSIIDGVVPAPEPVAAEIENYLGTDLLFYRAASPAGLVASQRAHWDPVVEWARETFGARFVLVEGVMHVPQPEAAIAAAVKAIPNGANIRECWQLGALNVVTTLTGSALLALALAAGRVTADEAWTAAHVDEDWNMQFWGRDEAIASAPRLPLRRDAGGGGGAIGAALTPSHRPPAAIRANTSLHSRGVVCRNSRMVGYQGVSSRPVSQRQSATCGNAVNTGRASAPARCAIEVSQVTTRSSFVISAAASTKLSGARDWHRHREPRPCRRTALASICCVAEPLSAAKSGARRQSRPAAQRPRAGCRAGGRTSGAPRRGPN